MVQLVSCGQSYAQLAAGFVVNPPKFPGAPTCIARGGTQFVVHDSASVPAATPIPTPYPPPFVAPGTTPRPTPLRRRLANIATSDNWRTTQ